MPLYFIALVPPPELEEQIRSFKEEVKKKFGAKKALKLPAHVTLQIPFKCAEETEGALVQNLSSFASQKEPFQVRLSGFDNFPPRVIFVKVVNHEPVVRFSEALQHTVSATVELNEREKSTSIHPHITIASRDLKRNDFKDAWTIFENRTFEDSFEANELFLFKHNGKTWDILRKFPLKTEEE